MGRTILAALAAAAACALVLGAGLASGGSPRGDASALSDRAFFAVLSGAKEIDGGDANGRGSATVTFDGSTLCWGITVSNLDAPVAAHIHRGGAKVNGGIVVPLEIPQEGDPGASSACTSVAAPLARAIRRKPGNYYVNVHTAAHQAGAIRGQLIGRRR